jgi:TIR domain
MPTKGKDYDVFLSHNSTDKSEVEVLARRLEDEAHLTPFLDKWHLVPGNPWQEEIEEALDRSAHAPCSLVPRASDRGITRRCAAR